MNKNWLEKLNEGVLPSALLLKEIEGQQDYGRNELVETLLDEVLPGGEELNPGIDVQEIYYPIWRWKVMTKRQDYGLSTEQLDEEVLRILRSWDKI